LITAGLFVIPLAAGCTVTTSGNGTPATVPDTKAPSTSPESASDELPTDGAPKVENPLETSTFEQDPCLSLTSVQTQNLNLSPSGSPVDMPLGKACEWRNDATKSEAQVGFLNEDPRGLSAEYRAEKAGRLKVFIELPPIEGHPAVVRGAIDDREAGGCTVVVGASDEIAFEVVIRLPEAEAGEKDPCEMAAEVAEMALETMKHG
jgi:hypothetical protein